MHNSLWVYAAFIVGGIVGAGIVITTVLFFVSRMFRAWILFWFSR
jgi:hypothetical protein